MKNPWLKIPLADYDGHMALPDVAQAALLADVVESALRKNAPTSIAILRCAGGSGFDRINPQVTTRVVGIDINPDCIAVARERFERKLPGLELIAADLQQDEVDIAPVDLMFAALLFEYVDANLVLKSVRSLLKLDGRLVTVVKLPKTDGPTVSPSSFTSLRTLSPCLRLVSPEFLRDRAAMYGMPEVESTRTTSRAGKSFQVQTFALPTENV